MRPVLAPPLGRTGGELSRARGEQRGQSNSPLKGVEQSGDRGHWGAVRRGAMTPRDLARSRSGVALATPAPPSPPRITRSPTCERLRGRGPGLPRRLGYARASPARRQTPRGGWRHSLCPRGAAPSPKRDLPGVSDQPDGISPQGVALERGTQETVHGDRRESDMADMPSIHPVKSAERVLEVLTLLAQHTRPVPTMTIARECGIPKSSAHQLLNVMRARHFVIYYDAEHAWGLGVASFEIGSAYLRSEPLQRLGRPVLVALTERTGDTSHLAILHGTEVLYLDKEEASGPASEARD